MIIGVYVQCRLEAEPMVYRDAVARGWVKKKDVVFTEINGKAWTQPTESMNVDAQMFLPPVTFVEERPDWLMRDLKRISYQISSDLLLGGSGIRLVQVFYEGVVNNAVPVDQILIRSPQSSARLMLPRFRQRRLRLCISMKRER